MVYRKRRNGKGKVTTKVVRSIVARELDKQIEDKSLSYALNGAGAFASVGNAWISFNPCNPLLGDGRDNRTGARIRIKSILIRGVLACGADQTIADDGYNTLRIHIGRWNAGTNTPLQSGGVGLNSPITHTREAGQLLNRSYYDQYIPLSVSSTEKGDGDGYTPQLKKFTFYKRFKNFYINWVDATADYPSSRILISCISDSSAVAHPGFVSGFMYTVFEDA